VRVRRHLPPAEARRLLRDAGPPNGWVFASFVAGAPMIGLAAVDSGPARLLCLIAGLAVLALPSVLDRDGWRIRIGMGWLAAEQRRRQQSPLNMPRTPAGADRWLQQPAATEAGLTQASVLMMAGRLAEARALVAVHQIADIEDRARVARLLAAIDGVDHGRIDPTAANAAIDALPPEARPYHRLSLAWSTAWVESSNRRPWRRAFAKAAEGIGTAGIPARYLAYGAFQELLAPVVGLIVVLGAAIVGIL
jgi:hypothetical protein